MEMTKTRPSPTGGFITEHYKNGQRVWLRHTAGKNFSGVQAEIDEKTPKKKSKKS